MKEPLVPYGNYQSVFPVADFTGAHITSREVVAALIRAVRATDSREVALDFRNVETISRAAAHQLISEIKGPGERSFSRVSISNANQDVNQMLNLVNRSISDKERRNDMAVEIGLPVVALKGVALAALLSSGKSS